MAGKAGRSGGNHMPPRLVPNNQEPPKKPSGLSKPAGKKWDELIELLPDDYLSPIDGFELKILCNLLCQADGLTAKLDEDPGAESTHRLYLNVCKSIHQLSAVFGLNPADRERLGLNKEDEDDRDPFVDFLNREGITAPGKNAKSISYAPASKESAK